MKNYRFICGSLVVGAVFALSGCDLFKPKATPVKLQANDDMALDYKVGDIFDSYLNNGGLTVSILMSDDSIKLAEVGTFTYRVTPKTGSTNPVNTSKPFTTPGDYVVAVSKTDFDTISYDIKVKSNVPPTPEKVLSKIEVSGQTTTCYIDDDYEFDGVVTATYSNDDTLDVTDEAVFDYPSTEKAGKYKVLVSYTEEDITKSTSYYLTVKEKEEPATLTSITVSGQKTSFIVGDQFSFGGTVTAHYSDGTTANVTSETSFSGYNLSVKGSQTVNVSYLGKTTSYTINVEESEPAFETITVSQAVEIIDELEQNVVSDEEYYIKGVCTNVELDNYGFNGGFLNSNLKFRSVLKNNVASSVDDINGKEIIIYGYLENYNGNYQIPYLPASASPTGSKYNSKLIWVESESTEETIDVTNVSVSPVSKTLQVNEKATLLATVLPQNATNKSITWTSSDSNVCSVSNSGEITAKSVGSAVITASANNGISATSNITVIKQEVTPVEGDNYEISFVHYEVDGQTELNSSTIGAQIESGSSYIDSYTDIYKIFKGVNGLKFGSNRAGGSLEFETTSSFANLDCKEVVLEVSVSGTSSKTVNLSLNDTQVASGSSADGKIVAKFDNPIKVSNVYISTSGRAYVSKVTFVCGETTPIPVTGISIPATKSISLGNSEALTVSYTPSNANTGKSITWKSSDTSVATVSNGLVTGIKAGTAEITATSQSGFTSKCTVTVSEIAVTGVSLSPTSETISIGGTKQLSATISPSNASNKNLTWSSSNTGVATVSSTGLVTAKAVGNATITVKTNNSKQATCAVTVTEQTKDAWTVLIYMCGADLESESGLATGDIKEILSVSNQPDDVNIVIETGGAKSWSLGSSYINGATKIDSSKLQRWHIENKKLTFDESLSTYTSMGSSSTLQSFVEYGIKEYPAEKTGVIFWNHGGAMYGCCYDEKKDDDSLTNSEMKSAFSKALANTGSSKLEFVGYDTCLTQVQDIAEFNSNYFNYMIASEEAEAGEGWDYDTWVDDLYAKKDTGTILTAIVDGFIKDNGGVSSTRSDQTLSWLDLTAMPAYKTAFESFASAMKSKLSSGGISKSTFASWMDKNVKAFCVDSDQDEAYYCLFDVKDMLNKLSSNSSYNPGSSYITALNSAFSNLVKYSVAQKGAGNAYGLGCIYCQASTWSKYIKSAYVSTETNFSNWLSFCKTYSYLA